MAIRKRPSISTNLNQTNRELLIHLPAASSIQQIHNQHLKHISLIWIFSI